MIPGPSDAASRRGSGTRERDGGRRRGRGREEERIRDTVDGRERKGCFVRRLTGHSCGPKHTSMDRWEHVDGGMSVRVAGGDRGGEGPTDAR